MALTNSEQKYSNEIEVWKTYEILGCIDLQQNKFHDDLAIHIPLRLL